MSATKVSVGTNLMPVCLPTVERSTPVALARAAAESAICVSFGQRGQDDVLAPYVEPYLAMVGDASALRGVWATKGEALRTTAVRNLFPVPADREPFLPPREPA